MNQIFKKAKVTKTNLLNEMRANNFTLQELRLFSIYLARINPWEQEQSRFVRFPLSEYQKIMDFGKMNIQQIKQSTDSLLSKVIHIHRESGGFKAYTLFSECTVDKDNSGEWFIEINASDNALPLMFNFRNKYFSYELWNALRLGSANQVRMYELLKQYEKIGQREISVDDLRAMLGISPDEYTLFSNFRRKVLEPCQAALYQTTDIKFTFRRGKTGRGGKWETIVFDIEKNNEYNNQLTLEEYIPEFPTIAEELKQEQEAPTEKDPLAEFCRDAFDDLFTVEEVRVFLNEIISKAAGATDTEIYDECRKVFNRFKVERQKTQIKHPYNYILTMLKNENPE